MKRRGSKLTLLALALVCASAASLAQGVPADMTPILQVLSLDNQRLAAQVKGDLRTLDKVLAPNLTYCHSNGICDTKQYFMDGIEGGRLKYLNIALSNTSARHFNGTVIVNGEADVVVSREGKEQSFRISYTDVYVKLDGRWQMVAWQSTRVQDSAPQPSGK